MSKVDGIVSQSLVDRVCWLTRDRRDHHQHRQVSIPGRPGVLADTRQVDAGQRDQVSIPGRPGVLADALSSVQQARIRKVSIPGRPGVLADLVATILDH